MTDDPCYKLRTSEASTQLTGPKLRENIILVMNIIAMPALCAAWLTFSASTGFVARIAAKMEKRRTKLPAPNIKGFFLPTRSKTKMMKLHGSSTWDINEVT